MAKFIQNKRWHLAVLLLTVFGYSGLVKANCPDGGARTSTATFGSVLAQRDSPIGTVLATVAVGSSYTSATGTCTIYALMNYGTLVGQYNSNNVYSTNIDGVGIRGTGGVGNMTFAIPATSYTGSGYFPTGTSTFYLIKTGPITSGDLEQKLLGTISFGSNKAGIINMGVGSVTQVACSITTPVIQVPLDDVHNFGDGLSGVGTTAKPKIFNVGLECDTGARVNVMMTGTKNTDTSTAGVLQLTDAGSAGVATGMGIQILYNNTPLTLNNNIVLKTSAGGQELLPFTARYFQTRSPIGVGEANASATLNITYQ